MSDEEYSPEMAQFVARTLRQASPKDFENLRKYYQQRGGPGLKLVQAEAAARKAQSNEVPLVNR